MNQQENPEVMTSLSTPDASAASAKQARREKNKPYRVALILYLTLAILALGATVAWFATNTNVYIENETPGNIQIQVSSGDLKISFTEDNFADKLTLIGADISEYIDVSGDGLTLYEPKPSAFNADDEPNLADLSGFDDITNDTRFYIEKRVYFRTTTAMEVYLSSSSSVDPAEGYINQQGVNAFSRKSLFGNIGCDAIVGAARVAFLEPVDDGEGGERLELKCVWIPNDRIALVYNGNTATIYTDDAHRESVVRGYGYLEKGATQMIYHQYVRDDYAYGKVAARTEQLANPDTNMINQSIPLLTFDKIGELQTKDLIIRIWFEGTDREADKALNGGQGEYLLNFVGIQKEECPTYLATEEEIKNRVIPDGGVGIYYNTAKNRETLCYYTNLDNYQTQNDTAVGDNFILYSTDGLVWRPYSASTGTTFTRKSEDYTIYIRIAEQAHQKAGRIVEITIPKKEPVTPNP